MVRKYILVDPEGITHEASTLKELSEITGITISALFRIKNGDVHSIKKSKFSSYSLRIV